MDRRHFFKTMVGTAAIMWGVKLSELVIKIPEPVITATIPLNHHDIFMKNWEIAIQRAGTRIMERQKLSDEEMVEGIALQAGDIVKNIRHTEYG
jgi:hypothetical protein